MILLLTWWITATANSHCWPAKRPGRERRAVTIAACRGEPDSPPWRYSAFILRSVLLPLQRFSRTHMTDMALLGLKELQMQNAELEFEISLKAVSVLRYITDHVERYGLVLMERGVDRRARPGFPQKCKHFDFLFICWFCFLSFSISVINRLLCTHNVPCVLVQLVDCCPWMRYTEGLSQLQRLLFWSLKRTLTDPCSFWLPLEVSWRST